ncbi:hypothetical protein KC19_1G084800 [Ceratodon purpureus]|uniref:NADH dehydrogenase subunit 1 n=1 Tax=Ceratodon purpureus TaxID=3225 RepID=A0A8T0J3Z0_CERPU|nr:hypothetical protein KC19_1G084800 [Ceratodon purpureus]
MCILVYLFSSSLAFMGVCVAFSSPCAYLCAIYTLMPGCLEPTDWNMYECIF